MSRKAIVAKGRLPVHLPLGRLFRLIPVITRAELDAALRIVRPHVPVTPAYRWPLLEKVTGTRTWVKHENATPTGAFKVRGGLVYVARLLDAERLVRGMITATRGNHGQSLAYAGRAHGIPVTIVVPERNSPDKNAAMQGFGAELIVHGRDFQEAREHAIRLAEQHSLHLVPSFHRDLVAGVATYAAELHDQAPDLDVVYVPVGQGSGLCANIAVRDLLGRRTEVVAVGPRARRRRPSLSRPGAWSQRPRRTPSSTAWLPGHPTRTPSRRWSAEQPGSSRSATKRPSRRCATCGRPRTRCPSRPAPSLSRACLRTLHAPTALWQQQS